MRWYVVHTQARCEERALSHLVAQDFCCFLPRLRKVRRHARRAETVLRPLFPRYLFVNIDLGLQRWSSIRSTIGVSALVCHGGRPIPVPDGIVEGLLDRCAADGTLAIDAPGFAQGDRVRLLDGPFADLIGSFERMADHLRVAVLLELMGRRVKVLVQRDMLEPA